MKGMGYIRFIRYLPLLLLAAISTADISFAKTASGLKIGVVNINLALEKYEKRKELEKQFMVLQAETEQQLRHKQSELKGLRDEIQLLDMGSESRRRNEETFEKKMMYLQLEEKMAENKLSKKQKELFEDLYRDIRLAIDTIGKREKFDLILKKEDIELESADIMELRLKIGIATVLYFSDALDITSRVIEGLNGSHYKQIEEN